MLSWPLPRFTLRLEGSGKIADTRRCMQCLYDYWLYKGYWGVATAAAVDLLNILVVFLLVCTLTMRFRWDVALTCSEAECAHAVLLGGVSRPHLFARNVAGYACGVVVLVSTLAATVYEAVRALETIALQREVEQLARDAGVDTGYLTPYHRWRAQQLLQQRRRRRRGYRRCDDVVATHSDADDKDNNGSSICRSGSSGDDHHHDYSSSHGRAATQRGAPRNGHTPRHVAVVGGYGVKATLRDDHTRHANGSDHDDGRRGGAAAAAVAASAAVAALHSGRQPLLSTMPWGEFVERVCQSAALRHGLKASCVEGASLSVLHAMQAMLRTDNFLVALHDAGVLDEGARRYMRVDTVAYLIEGMFDAFDTLHPPAHAVWAVRARALRLAVVYGVAYVFVATYAVVKVLVKHAAAVKADYHALAQREWSVRARWCFRLYNEVPHMHACRLAHGGDVARHMVQHLRVSSSVARLLRRGCSACVCAIVALSFANPPLLMAGRVAGVTLVWWLTLALLLHAAVAEDDVREREYVYTTDLRRLVAALHYARSEWYESGEAFVHSLTRDWLHSRLQLIAHDLTRTLLVPLVLVAALFDGSVEALTSHVHACAVFVDGVGSVAAGSVFDDVVVATTRHSRNGNNFDNNSNNSSDVDDGDGSGGWLHMHGDDDDDAAATSSSWHAQRVRNSVASFSALYPQWALQHMHLCSTTTRAARTRTHTPSSSAATTTVAAAVARNTCTQHTHRCHGACRATPPQRHRHDNDNDNNNNDNDDRATPSSSSTHARNGEGDALRCFLRTLHTRVATTRTHARNDDGDNDETSSDDSTATRDTRSTAPSHTRAHGDDDDDDGSSSSVSGSSSSGGAGHCTRNSVNNNNNDNNDNDDDNDSDARLRRSLLTLRCTTTAHEREQLFVSQAAAAAATVTTDKTRSGQRPRR